MLAQVAFTVTLTRGAGLFPFIEPCVQFVVSIPPEKRFGKPGVPVATDVADTLALTGTIGSLTNWSGM
ncbi:MAG: hypothetical protein CMJ21_00570 [Phycisphaerae bacterium]|nr:hypothetical protein [Phycisphaerae bacterium]MDP7347426.1 hypothetical protein [Phycisphaeraceae bacterium]